MNRNDLISTNNVLHLSVNVFLFFVCCSLKEVERIISYKTTSSTVSKQNQCKKIGLLVSLLYLLSSLQCRVWWSVCGGTVASWLVCLPPAGEVRVQVLAGDIVLCP